MASNHAEATHYSIAALHWSNEVLPLVNSTQACWHSFFWCASNGNPRTSCWVFGHERPARKPLRSDASEEHAIKIEYIDSERGKDFCAAAFSHQNPTEDWSDLLHHHLEHPMKSKLSSSWPTTQICAMLLLLKPFPVSDRSDPDWAEVDPDPTEGLRAILHECCPRANGKSLSDIFLHNASPKRTARRQAQMPSEGVAVDEHPAEELREFFRDGWPCWRGTRRNS